MHHRYYRSLRNINRLALFPMHKPQSVAEHSYALAVLCSRIADSLESAFIPVDKALLLDRALYHDIPETVTGDIPYTFKQVLNQTLGENRTSLTQLEMGWFSAVEGEHVTQHERDAMWGTPYDDPAKLPLVERVLSFADMLELFLTTSDEIALGNSMVEEVSQKAFDISWNRFNNLFSDREKQALLLVDEVSLLLDTVQAVSDGAVEIMEARE